MQQPKTRVYEENNLQPGLNTSTYCSNIKREHFNSNVRAQAKTHGRTPILIELPKGRHLGSDACIFWARTPASTLHESAQQWASNAYIFHVQEHNPDIRAPRRYARHCMRAPRKDVCVPLARVHKMRA